MVRCPVGCLFAVKRSELFCTVTVERDRIYNAPAFDYARIEEYSRPDYINNVYSYYGRKRRRGSWCWSFWRYFNDHDRRRPRQPGRLQRLARQQVRTQQAGAAASPAAGASVAGSPAPNAAEGPKSTSGCGRGRGRSGSQGA
jgi:hypothetical protein